MAWSTLLLVYATLLPNPNEEVANPYWEKDHPLGRRWRLERFALLNASESTSGGGMEVRIVMGLTGIDRTGTDPTDDNDLGVPVYLETFDMGAPEAQLHALALCDEFEAASARLHISRLDCFMRELKLWLERRSEPFPVDLAVALLSS